MHGTTFTKGTIRGKGREAQELPQFLTRGVRADDVEVPGRCLVRVEIERRAHDEGVVYQVSSHLFESRAIAGDECDATLARQCERA
jgi:hypothetical protein